jgi:SAM-dependent methyltransferase
MAISFSDFDDPAFAAEFAARRHDRIERVVSRLVPLAGIGAGQRVVDLCCGPGLLTRRLADLVGPAGMVIGVDGSEAMVELARRETAGMDNVQIVHRDGYAVSTAVDAPVDHVVATSAWQNFLTDHRRLLGELGRTLEPGGRFSFDVRLRIGETTDVSFADVVALVRVRVPGLELPDAPERPARQPYGRAELDRDLALLGECGFRLIELVDDEQGGAGTWLDRQSWRFEYWLARNAPDLSAPQRAEVVADVTRELREGRAHTETRRVAVDIVAERTPQTP